MICALNARRNAPHCASMRHMKSWLLIVALPFLLLTAGCENMQQWTQTIQDLNKTLLPLTVFKKSTN